jgi:trypsin-like peptidase/tetratricopeptide repeat protein
MGEPLATQELRSRADELIDILRDEPAQQDLDAARSLIGELRDRVEFEKLLLLVEALSRASPGHAKTRRLYAQALIDTGKATAAVDVLSALISTLAADDPERYEALGLTGRAFKQIYVDFRVKGAMLAQQALAQSIAAYRQPYEADPKLYWHGLNLLALLDNAYRRGMKLSVPYEPRALAAQLLGQLQQVPEEKRDEWYLACVAEASLGTRDWDVIARNLRQYAEAPGVREFHLKSTLRQFTEVWELGESQRGQAVLEILRAKLARSKQANVEIAAHEVNQQAADKSQYEAILGKEGAKTFEWWRTGMQRANSVAAIRQKLADRVGTGFLLRAGDIGREPQDELFVLTNFHVVNKDGLRGGLTADQAEIVFEAVDPNLKYPVLEVVWDSPEEECDAALLRVQGLGAPLQPMKLAKALPLRNQPARVYIIGHPGGRELSFSLQDNELIDHEGEKGGTPAIPGIVRVHYRAPTEGGSSGSPVFNASAWEVIALHHKGGMLGMPRLNGAEGTYAANEGISLASIIGRMK